uniref:Uncharacterized protein n=1 Tax=Trichogramma kaykai TaxID=54128 RepID=A0ABD2WBD0_9HYME
MDSDVSVGTAEKKAADKIKQLQLQQKATSLKKSISSKDYNQSTASTSKNKSAIEQLVESLVDPQNMENLNKDLQVPSIESSTLKPSSKNKRNIAGKTTSTKPTYQNHKSTIKNGVSSNKNLPKLWNTVAQQVTFESKKSDDILPSTKTSALAGIMDLLQDCYAEIKGLKKDVCALTEEVRLMRSSGGKSGDQSSSFVGTIKQLNDKYKYQLPCIYKSEFEEFESDLSTNEQLCIDVKNVLLTGIDSSLVISKSIVKMLKLFLEKDVAIHYTAIKATEKKKAILNTQLFQWILAVIKERRTMASQETHQDQVHSALSSVMSNVPSWKLTSVRAIEMKKLKEDSSAKTTTVHNSNDQNLNLPSSKNQASGQNNLTNALVDNINSSSNSSEDSYISDNDDSQSSEGEMNSEFAKSLYVQLS